MYRYKICDVCGNIERNVNDDDVNFSVYSITCEVCTRKEFRFDSVDDILENVKDYNNEICSLCGVIKSNGSMEFGSDNDGYYLKCIDGNDFHSDCSQRIISNHSNPTPISLRLYNLRSRILGLDKFELSDILEIESTFVRYYNIHRITKTDMGNVNDIYRKYFIK
jgi:hypothetical protein